MIGNSYLNSLYKYVDLDTCDSDELFFLTISSAIIDYFFQLNDVDIPEWIIDERLAFDTPYYYSKRLTDFEKVKLQFSNPTPFRKMYILNWKVCTEFNKN